MSNLNYPPGFFEPRPHHPRCPALCDDDDCTEHSDHTCLCDEIESDRQEREAEALMEYTYQQYLYDKEP